MSISSKFILEQGAVIRGMGEAAWAAITQKPGGSAPATPGPELTLTVPPRSPELLKTYVRHVGGDPAAYKDTIPPHFFPQWGFALGAKTLLGVPYPLTKVMNGGCRIEVNAPLSTGEPLLVRARLESIDDDGRRAVLKQRIVTGTGAFPDALVAYLYAIVPLAKKSNGEAKPKKEKPRVPEHARELAYWRIGASAGLDFAKLTGDFNPIHWVPAYARASGFKNTILHGFGTFARAYEGLRGRVVPPGEHLKLLDVQFTRPLVLPAKVGLYAAGGEVFVGDAPGGPAYLVGKYELSGAARAGDER